MKQTRMEAPATAASSSCSSLSPIFSSSSFADLSEELDEILLENTDVPSCLYPRPPTWFPMTTRCCRRNSAAAETLWFFIDDVTDRPHHFLDACFLCKRRIRNDRDIFMYRGDSPFCTEECREEQMEMDEALENHRKQHHVHAASAASTPKNCASDKSSVTIRDNAHGFTVVRNSPAVNVRTLPLVAR